MKSIYGEDKNLHSPGTQNPCSGTALIFSLIFSVILTIGVAGYLAYVNGQADIVKHYTDYGRAFYLAEAGIDKAIIELEKYCSPPSTFPGIEATGLGDGSYRLEPAGAIYEGDMIKYELHSIGSVNGITREVVAEVQTESFAKWAYFTNTENYLIHFWWWWFEVPVWFTAGSYLEGPVHTNGQYNVSGYPVFNGPVSSVSDTINYMHGPDEDGIKFYDETVEDYDAERDAKYEPDELNLGVDEIDIAFLSADRLKEAALEAEDSDAMQFTGDTKITFLEDGTMKVTNADREWHNEVVPQPSAITVEDGDGDFSGSIETQKIYVNNGDLDISGEIKAQRIFVHGGNLDITKKSTIDTQGGAWFAGENLSFSDTVTKGTVTTGAGGDVIIKDDVKYNTDPRLDPASQDKLGIISEGNVIIDKNAPQNPDPPDPNGVSIHASIIAIDKSFTVERYWSGKKHVLSVLGGIIQKERGPVGTFQANPYRKVSGYDKNYQYDQRMRTSPPPYFPLTGEYEKIYWKEELNED